MLNLSILSTLNRQAFVRYAVYIHPITSVATEGKQTILSPEFIRSQIDVFFQREFL